MTGGMLKNRKILRTYFKETPVTMYQRFTNSTCLPDVLHVLQLPELAEGVVPQRLVQRRVAVLVGDVEVGALAHLTSFND